VDTIAIDNRNIYDTSDPRYDGFLFRAANRLHIVSRKRVIEQEILLRCGEPYSRKRADETARNLRHRLAVNDAWVETEILPDGRLLVRVITVDQWSLLGGVKGIHRDGNETDYQFGVEERNLLGWGKFLSLDWFINEIDANFITLSLVDPRLTGRKLRGEAFYSSDPRNNQRFLSFGRPFYDREQRISFRAAVADSRRISERFASGELVADWHSQRDAAEIDFRYRWGSYTEKTTAALEYRYLYQRVTSRRLFDPTVFLAEDFPGDSVFHQFNLTLGHAWQRFIVVHRIDGFTFSEDVTLETSAEVTVGRAFSPHFDDYRYNYVTGSLTHSRQSGPWILAAGYRQSRWLRGNATVRRTAQFLASAYNNALSFVTFACRTYLRTEKSDFANGINLGGKNGIRGYVTEYDTGELVHVVNLEARFFPGLELLSAGIGGALFFDLGRAWDNGEGIELGDYHASFGAGLRISLEKLTRTELVRIDFAYSQGDSWEISAGTGQYF